MIGGFVRQGDTIGPEAAIGVTYRTTQQGLDVLVGKRFELEDLAPRDQRCVQGEEGVLRGGTDQNHHTVLHVVQQHVLLGPVEAV